MARLILAVLLMASPAMGQSRTSRAVLFGGAALDGAVTEYGIRTGRLVETYPPLRGESVHRVTMEVLSPVCVDVLAKKLNGRHPTAARRLEYISGAVHVYFGLNGMREMRR